MSYSSYVCLLSFEGEANQGIGFIMTQSDGDTESAAISGTKSQTKNKGSRVQGFASKKRFLQDDTAFSVKYDRTPKSNFKLLTLLFAFGDLSKWWCNDILMKMNDSLSFSIPSCDGRTHSRRRPAPATG